MTMYQSKNFTLFELVDKATFDAEGEAAWDHFDKNALSALDDLSDFFSTLKGEHVPITCNTWHSGGQFQFRGYRPPTYQPGITPGSAHRVGKAFDVDVHGYTAEQARQTILANKDSSLLLRIMRLEADVNWLHLDVMDTGKPRIYIFHA